ncbi:MAG: hypothetical protein ACFFC7_31280 [Candidatus Hermodarchaeota archaeon]
MSDPLLLIAFWANLILGILLVGIGIFAYLKLEKTRTSSLLAASYAIIGLGLISHAVGYLFSQPGEELFIGSQRMFYAAPVISISCLVAIALVFRIGEQVYSPKYTVIIALIYLLPVIILLFTQVIGLGYIEIWTTEIFGGTENLLVEFDVFLVFIYIPLMIASVLFNAYLFYKEYKDQPAFLQTMLSFDIYVLALGFIAFVENIFVPLLGGVILISFLAIFQWFQKSLPREQITPTEEPPLNEETPPTEEPIN